MMFPFILVITFPRRIKTVFQKLLIMELNCKKYFLLLLKCNMLLLLEIILCQRVNYSYAIITPSDYINIVKIH